MLDSILVWFRRDLRDIDHAALGEALRRARRVYCAFVFDREILDALEQRADRRVEFIRESLLELDVALRRRGGGLLVLHGWASREIPRLAGELGVAAVFANRDYEPQAKRRDAIVASALNGLGISFEAFKDQALLDGEEVLTQAGRPHTVFTPYKKAWLKRLTEDDWQPYEARCGTLANVPRASGVPTLGDLGFSATNLHALGIVPGMSGARLLLEDFLGRISRYHEQRDFPAAKGVSYLSVHLRFGTISIRELVARAIAAGALGGSNEGAATWLSELVWRDFYFMILDRFPHVAERAFKPAYDAIRWEQGPAAEQAFTAWCAGRTGYPLVDAAMRQLNATGYMHNRLRMLSASFLCKDLGLDWRRGEAYFAARLNDFDLSANNGGWQWAASSGCDAQPYFRIFNPLLQSQRFDPDGRFIRRYVPELAEVPDRFIHAPWRMSQPEQSACGVIIGRHTPAPLVDHQQARERTLQRYAVVKRPAAP
ncbi:deoxyribodipyrimidine photo-lyase [Accumulibacter sp.]|uniref:cryptochrome/photolyase family protein n=1 Tax=Accumulibacter sp. TaxID=2053492 RepID=UPI0025EADB16|nr:deoxyribodipyrimidine photo-lyase [Accumulibacter sp.]MCP5229622.1 deoxyribodipyrimidine photo-lyase [Accumulibacter sp.]